jgi:hypothetical protein
VITLKVFIRKNKSPHFENFDMELDELKNIWQQTSTQNSLQAMILREDLQRMISRKSEDTIQKLKRNIIIETIAGIVLSVTMAGTYFIQNRNDNIGIIALGSVAMMGSFMVIYWKAYRSLKQFSMANLTLKNTLQQLVEQLESFIRLYLYANLLMTPIAIFAGAFWGSSFTSLYRVPIITTLILVIPMYYSIKWYVNKVYGQYLYKLKQYLLELEESVA